MNDQNFPDKNTENLFRKELDSLQITPDENTWAGIAEQQAKRNIRLRLRRISRIALSAAAALALVLFGLWRSIGPAHAPETLAAKDASQPAAKMGISVPGPVKLDATTTQPVPQKQSPQGQTRYNNLARPSFCRINSVPAKVLQFQAETGIRYRDPATGTTVYIPPFTLQYPDGAPVRGAVELQFQEYRNIGDYLASGIPMHYGDTRGDFNFNSGGMFELHVYQNGTALEMAAGQNYELNFSPTHPLTQPSLFYFDDNTGRWTYQQDPSFVAPENGLPPAVSEAVAIRDNVGSGSCVPPLLAPPEGSDMTQSIREGVQTGYDLAKSEQGIPLWFRTYHELSNERLLGQLEQSNIEVIHHPDHQEMFFTQDLNNVFSELKAFKNTYFLFTSDPSRKPVDLGGNWEQVYVVQQKGPTCLVSLYGKQGLVQEYANLIPSAGNDTFDYEHIYAEYRHLRARRQANFVAQIQALRHFLLVAPMFQSDPEWCMTESDWMKYFEANLALMEKRYAELVHNGLATSNAAAGDAWRTWNKRRMETHLDENRPGNRRFANRDLNFAVTNTLRLRRFGLFNCDQIFRGFDTNSHFFSGVHFKTAEGLAVTPRSITVLERSTRLFFTLAMSATVPCIPGRPIDLVLTDEKGHNYLVPGSVYARTPMIAEQPVVFVATDVTDQARTPADWATLLAL